MLKFNSYPPQAPEDVAFTEEFSDGLDEYLGLGRPDYEDKTLEVGRILGSTLIANMENKELGNVLDIVESLAESKETSRDSEIKGLLLKGAIDGAHYELDELARAGSRVAA